jgi:Protein of unknown function (DUF2281)
MSDVDKLYNLAKTLPDDQMAELSDFAEFLHQKRSRHDAGDEVKGDRLDFRRAAGLGQEIWQSVDVEQYTQQERATWD